MAPASTLPHGGIDDLRRALDALPGRHPSPPPPAPSAAALRSAPGAAKPPAPARAVQGQSAREPAIAVRGLSKRYGATLAVDGLSFTVPRGGVTGFVGPNGAGKTTTIRMLLHLIRSSGGTATVLGQPIAHPRRYLPRVGALIEAPAFYPYLSGRRNLRVFAHYAGSRADRIPDLLHLVGLAEKGGVPYRQYSLGMKQRLGIAAALLSDPDVLILDEPTNGLDPSGIREVRDLLRRIGDSGKTVFVSSHLLGEVQRMCDHLVVIRKGRLVFEGSVDDLLAAQVGIVACARDPARNAQLAALAQRAGHRADAQEGRVLVHAPPAWAGELGELALRAGIALQELRPQAGDLEETVLTLTGRGSL